MIEAGRYKARAVEGDYGYANTGTEQVAVLFELEDGNRITWYGYLSEKAAERTLESLSHCGVSDLATLEGLGSQEVELDIRHEPDLQGQVRARVAFVNKLGSGGVAMKSRMDDAQKRNFADRFKGKWAKLQQQKGTAGNSPPADNGASDDIPF